MKKLLRRGAAWAAPLLWRKFFHGGTKPVWPHGKKAAVTVSFDPDYPEDVQSIPRLLEIFNGAGFKSSFACIGRWIEKYPRVHHQILDEGHEIINHTYSHPNNEFLNAEQFFNKMPEKEQEQEIAGFEATAKTVLDYTPVGFRSPHFGDLHTQSVYNVLERRGYAYSSSTNMTVTDSHGLPYRPSKGNFRKKDENGYNVLELPMVACPEHFFPVFDTWHCYRTQPPAHPEDGEFSRLFKKAITLAERHGTYANFYFDPRDVAHRNEFQECMDWLKGRCVWVASSRDVAHYWNKTVTSRT
ncbi:polysaccharide deacetylase family protein [Candidatus Micrarchaeota archaeon]|nr:polysaccharide deacetylase family protein [Candidatus Micrarchaeota archaeon]